MSRGGALIAAGVALWGLALLMTAAHVLGRVIVLADAGVVILCVTGIVLIFRERQP